MFRQILMAPEDQQYQTILWRSSPSVEIKAFKLKTVTFGMGPASFLATRTLKQVAEDSSARFPEAAKRIRDDIYVDDIMTGADTITEAKILRSTMAQLLAEVGFPLRKWTSNKQQLLEDVPEEQREVSSKEIQENTKSVKLLGLQWNPCADSFYFQVTLESEPIATKRQILSEASRVFDPLGWVAPVIVRIKILFQNLWLQKLGWDDELPIELKNEWLLLRSELLHIQNIKIPRWLSTSQAKSIELHGFSDASEKAYAAAVYCRCEIGNKLIKVSLISAKTKVAPLSKTTIPRLELCAATLLTNLMKAVIEALEMNISRIYAWSDSKIVLDWLSSHPSRWPTFVANRTAKILRSIDRAHWYHVPSQENSADCASRGMSPKDLADFTIWWNGPSWLSQAPEFWPIQEPTIISRNLYLSNSILLPTFIEELATRFSSWFKFLKTLAIVIRFISNAKCSKQERKGSNNQRNKYSIIKVADIELSRKLVISEIQQNHFAAELCSLKRQEPVSKSSKLKFLSPFLDNEGIIRVGGRIKHSLASFGSKHPVILPKCYISNIIIHDLHLRFHHAGQSFLISTLRQTYWILSCRDLVRKVVHKCATCVRNKASLQEQLMADLPTFRVEQTRPFLKVGIDYAGPIEVYMKRGRGQRPIKSYICIFVCLSTKAIHIELVGDLSTDTFLGAFKRFTSRRGVCSDVFSDNGTNFVGASNQLMQLYEFLKTNNNTISNYFSKNTVNWHFNPPSAPHFGGIWEAAVKSTKFHLKRVIGQNILTYEEMATLLTEIEAILNSRPLCVLSADDLDALTPAHFLVGHPLTQIPEVDIQDVSINRLTRWQLVKQTSQHFWKRWSDEYLTTLQSRTKWYNKKSEIKQGDIVILKNENVPPTHWILGKIEETHPGPDGRVRVVTVKTKSGKLKRPIHKLCLLPHN